MPRAELSGRPRSFGAVHACAKLLMLLNAGLLVGAYFAVQAYQKMHAGEVSNLEFVVFELLAAIDIAAAFAVIRGRWRVGIGFIALTSTVWCVGSIAMQVESGKQLSVLSILVTNAIAYWDVALLAALMYRAMRSPVARSASEAG